MFPINISLFLKQKCVLPRHNVSLDERNHSFVGLLSLALYGLRTEIQGLKGCTGVYACVVGGCTCGTCVYVWDVCAPTVRSLQMFTRDMCKALFENHGFCRGFRPPAPGPLVQTTIGLS